MGDNHIPSSIAQIDAINYQEILDLDSRPVPPALRERCVPDLGTAPVPTSHYTSPDLFRDLIDKMWLKTWQMACREEQIPNVGDFYVYEIVGKSVILVRSAPDEVKALNNSCLHRGRTLSTGQGHKHKFTCAFHGMSWNIDGSFAHNPFEWDFPHCTAAGMALPEARVGKWGGFIFVNFDPEAPSLEETLDPIPRHFERWNFPGKYIAAYVGKKAKCNWQVAFEAFMETHHSLTTHPRFLPFITDANAQYDVFNDHVGRHISARGLPSPHLKGRGFDEDRIASILLSEGGREIDADAPVVAVPEGMTARSYVADILRKRLGREIRRDMDHAADCELGDSLIYTLFPTLQMWGGFLPNWVYRFRPVGRAYNESFMEVFILKDVPEGASRPDPAALHMLKDDESWTNADELGALGRALDEDWSNMEQVQIGLEASQTGVVQLGHYLEMRIRQHHDLIDRYLSR